MRYLRRVIFSVPTEKKVAALTFNIANGRNVPLRMLAALKKLGVKKATFFLTGMWARANPSIAKRIRQHGYEIASHGHQHQNYTEHSERWIEQDVHSAIESIARATDITTQIIRTPSGDIDERVARKLLKLGQTVVHWDIDSLDWKYKDINRIVKRVVPPIHPGAIILLHACDPWTQSLKAVPRIVQGLRRKGYRFVTVKELLAERNVLLRQRMTKKP